MTTEPLISVVVPTCGRPESLRRLLGRLAWQASAPPFEVLVVLDGVAADSAGVEPGSTTWPFTLRVARLSGTHGAAAARNLGAQLALGTVLLFLDDDVEPGPQVLAAHASLHAGEPWLIGIGALTPRPVCGGFIGNALAGWWEVMNERLCEPRHRFTFRDLLSGHCSMMKATFERVGAFDESLLCHEDFEFGHRALQCGVSLRCARGADADHHDGSDVGRVLQRKRDEGRADVQLARTHVELAPVLPLGRTRSASRLASAVYILALRRSGALDWLVPAGLRLGMAVFERLTMRDKWRAALDRAMEYAYWSGVRAEAGSVEAIRELQAPLPPYAGRVVEVDLLDGLPAVEDRLDRLRPDGVRVRLGTENVGAVAPEAGVEPLRGVHLRPLLLTHMAGGFAQAAARTGLLPPILQGCVPSSTSRERCGIINPP